VLVRTLVAGVGAVAWGVLALSRGERISAIWLVAAAVGSYAIAYRFYARFIARRVLRVDDRRATPAERLDNGIDFHPTDRRVLFGHHFAAISGAGPLVGPVLAAQMGYLPGTIWITAGVIFAGAVQDMMTLFFSMRRDGRSLGQMARDEIGPIGGAAALIAVFAIMIILLAVLAVLALVVVNALAGSPWGTFSIAMTIPIALFMGFYLRTLRPGRVLETSAIGVVLLIVAIVAGSWVAESGWAASFTLKPTTLVAWLVVYGFAASVLPVWMLLAPRDYLTTFMKIGTIVLLAVAVLMESFVAIMALIAVCLLDSGLYYAINAPAGLLGNTAASASAAVNNLGFTITPEALTAAAAAVGEHTLIARTGGAPTLAIGMSEIFAAVFGGGGMKAFWYHFAIMFEALFILTTVDAGTRVGRFMLQDTLGNLYRPLRQVSWRPGLYATSAMVVGAWGYFLFAGVTDPLGGINQLFPFGIANQLLAAVALTVATTLLIKSGRVRYAWVPGIPLLWDAAVTLTASWQKIFSTDPKLGFFAQAGRFSDALAAGKVLAPAKNLADMRAVVTNSIVDGVLSILFAALIIIVILDAARMCIATLRAPSLAASTETPFVPSQIPPHPGRSPQLASATWSRPCARASMTT
jgi:carbon starvation protein